VMERSIESGTGSATKRPSISCIVNLLRRSDLIPPHPGISGQECEK
jgi:hypothetical protein